MHKNLRADSEAKHFRDDLPAKEAEGTPWECLCVDLIGEYKIKQKGKKMLKMKAVAMIDPATRWFEIV